MPMTSKKSPVPGFCTSRTMFTAMVMIQAKMSRMSMGSVAASKMRRKSDLGLVRVNSFVPYLSALRFTCSGESPDRASDSKSLTTDSVSVLKNATTTNLPTVKTKNSRTQTRT